MVGEALRLAWLWNERAAFRHTVSRYEDRQPAGTETESATIRSEI